MNRNKFLNQAAELLLALRQEYRCGNLKTEDLPSSIRRYFYLISSC
jgi:hypothetical protein